jgi:hypothetical protein
MEMVTFPAHRRLNGVVKVAQRHPAREREATPDRRPDAAQRHLQADDVVRVAGGLGHDRCILLRRTRCSGLP